MSTETERLAREAELHRNHLDETLDQLKSRLSMGQILDEMSGYIRDGQGAEMTRNLGRQVRDNPLALGLIAAGVAWLCFGQGSRRSHHHTRDVNWRGEGAYEGSYFDPYRAEGMEGDRARGMNGGSRGDGSGAIRRVTDTAKSAVSGAMESAQRTFGSISGASTGAAGTIRHSARDMQDAAYRSTRSLYRRTTDAGYRANDMMQSTWSSFNHALRENPLVVGAVAVAVGAAIGAALPSTRQEDRLLGSARDQVRDSAKSYGQEAVQKVQNVASEAYEAGREKAYHPDQPDAGLAETVISAGEAATDAARKTAKKEGML
ncbi:DUF3618 domain-containing protein [Rhodoligotrophos defluvii]|uniref:DUF3618 domain-containing protein n=1 Tax=Rhodoligotrophos defluvii TaxID=2561934 RepID=UPI0010C99DB3|nr:DUF3618 domain-containing protein [Rhodoligotrophos defluvii]